MFCIKRWIRKKHNIICLFSVFMWNSCTLFKSVCLKFIHAVQLASNHWTIVSCHSYVTSTPNGFSCVTHGLCGMFKLKLQRIATYRWGTEAVVLYLYSKFVLKKAIGTATLTDIHYKVDIYLMKNDNNIKRTWLLSIQPPVN